MRAIDMRDRDTPARELIKVNANVALSEYACSGGRRADNRFRVEFKVHLTAKGDSFYSWLVRVAKIAPCVMLALRREGGMHGSEGRKGL